MLHESAIRLPLHLFPSNRSPLSLPRHATSLGISPFRIVCALTRIYFISFHLFLLSRVAAKPETTQVVFSNVVVVAVVAVVAVAVVGATLGQQSLGIVYAKLATRRARARSFVSL